MTLNYVISPAAENDLPMLAEIETMAVLSSPIYSIYFRPWVDIPGRISAFHTDLRSATAEPRTHILKATECATGRIEGYIVWTEYGEAPDPHAKQSAPPVLGSQYRTTKMVPSNKTATAEQLSLPIRVEVVGDWRAEAAALKAELLSGTGAQAYVQKLYVHPRSQNCGIGTSLWRHGPGNPSRRYCKVSLIAMSASQGFYEHIGFTRCGYFDIDLSHHAPSHAGFGLYRFQGMIREAR